MARIVALCLTFLLAGCLEQDAQKTNTAPDSTIRTEEQRNTSDIDKKMTKDAEVLVGRKLTPAEKSFMSGFALGTAVGTKSGTDLFGPKK